MAGAGFIWMYTRKIITANWLMIMVALLIMADLIPVDSRYLGKEKL